MKPWANGRRHGRRGGVAAWCWPVVAIVAGAVLLASQWAGARDRDQYQRRVRSSINQVKQETEQAQNRRIDALEKRVAELERARSPRAVRASTHP